MLVAFNPLPFIGISRSPLLPQPLDSTMLVCVCVCVLCFFSSRGSCSSVIFLLFPSQHHHHHHTPPPPFRHLVKIPLFSRKLPPRPSARNLMYSSSCDLCPPPLPYLQRVDGWSLVCFICQAVMLPVCVLFQSSVE